MNDALALIELDSVASGLAALDTMVKQAPIEVLEANLVEPGKFLILYTGGVAEVEESHQRVMDVFQESVGSSMFLPMVHGGLVDGLRGTEQRKVDDALGVVEGTDVASTLLSADGALKGADVDLVGIRVAIGLGGRGYFLVSGAQHDVQASIDVAASVLEPLGRLHRIELIARPHDEMVVWLLRPAPFRVG
jgi:microcompartment protein CcmL/EutN